MFVPEMLVVQNPTGYSSQRLGREPESVVATSASAANEPGAFEDANVLAKAGQRHGIWFGEVGNAGGAAGEALEDGAPRGIRDGGQDAVDVVFATAQQRGGVPCGLPAMLNHTVQSSSVTGIVNRIVH